MALAIGLVALTCGDAGSVPECPPLGACTDCEGFLPSLCPTASVALAMALAIGLPWPLPFVSGRFHRLAAPARPASERFLLRSASSSSVGWKSDQSWKR